MDLSFVQEQLDTFATFAGAIGDFLRLPAEILGKVADWFNGEEVNPVDGTKNTDISADWDVTKDALGSSKDSE
ncbi:PorH family porin [Corynebacterium sp.]|uniref:PorH family porin n=1 Tax=Corynebacterium sp. TaxID=1720 RepID=UPI0028ABC182|nr:PorH family porin [Corynebacterium sp.]